MIGNYPNDDDDCGPLGEREKGEKATKRAKTS